MHGVEYAATGKTQSRTTSGTNHRPARATGTPMRLSRTVHRPAFTSTAIHIRHGCATIKSAGHAHQNTRKTPTEYRLKTVAYITILTHMQCAPPKRKPARLGHVRASYLPVWGVKPHPLRCSSQPANSGVYLRGPRNGGAVSAATGALLALATVGGVVSPEGSSISSTLNGK